MRRKPRYEPTPEGMKKEIHVVLLLLGNAHKQLDKLGIPRASVEESSAGTCYPEPEVESEGE